ncbi:MAG: MarR family transcriptional regulator [Thermoplasmata archaeon]|nr:MarR family transcriptional regulator [Thermoplasmata archaeon]
MEAGAAALEDLISETMLFFHAAARRHGLTLIQFVALRLVQVKGPLAPSELADRLGISRPAATSSINILEAGGWVVRTHPTGDRRRLGTSLTSRSRRALRTLASERRRYLQRGLDRIAARERREFGRITSLLVEQLRGSRPAAETRGGST